MRLRARSRITLVVDPTCTPNEVAAEYRRQRRRVFGRTRRLTPKLAALAEFTIEHESVGWPEQMQLWNASGPRRARFKDVTTFRRECEQALTRLRELRLPRRQQSSTMATPPRDVEGGQSGEPWAIGYRPGRQGLTRSLKSGRNLTIRRRSNGDADNRH